MMYNYYTIHMACSSNILTLHSSINNENFTSIFQNFFLNNSKDHSYNDTEQSYYTIISSIIKTNEQEILSKQNVLSIYIKRKLNIINIHVDIKYTCVVVQYTNRNIQCLSSNENDISIEEHPIFFFFLSIEKPFRSWRSVVSGLIAAGNNTRGELIVRFYSYGEMKSEITNKLAPIRLFITAVIVAANQSIVSSGEHRWFQLN